MKVTVYMKIYRNRFLYRKRRKYNFIRLVGSQKEHLKFNHFYFVHPRKSNSVFKKYRKRGAN